MSKNTEGKETATNVTETKPEKPGYKIITFTLPNSGVKVEIDMSKCTVELLDEARKVGADEADGFAISHHMLSKMSKFNGKELSVPEVKYMLKDYAFDLIALEDMFAELRKKPKNIQIRTSV